MKTKNAFSLFICLFTIALCPIVSIHAQQWLPNFANSNSIIYRMGNVGIGISSPQSPLHISNDVGTVKDPALDPSVIDGQVVNTGGSQSNTSFDIRIDKNYSNGSSHWAMNSGTSFDFLKQDNNEFVRKLSINNIGMRLFGTRISIGEGVEQLNIGYGPTGHFMALGYKPGSETHFISSGTTGGAVLFSDGQGELSFATKSSGLLNVNTDTKMTITANGNIGIGVSSPLKKLHLANAKNVSLRLEPEGGKLWDVSASMENQEFTVSCSDENPYLRIKENGRVAIGTDDTPSSLDGDATDISAYKLYVEGGILTKEVRVREIWADYVFEKDYNLLPLEEVENYIVDNGHLPNTPSAEEVAAQGINLGAATANQQEKIEELYLHLIAMNKRLAALEAENAALRKAIVPTPKQ